MTRSAAGLLDEAVAAPVAGWDFTWAGERITVSPLPWDFRALTADAMLESAESRDLVVYQERFLLSCRRVLSG